MSLIRAVLDRYRISADPLRTQRRIELVAVLSALLLCVQLVVNSLQLVSMAAPEPVEPAADLVRVPAIHTLAVLADSGREEITSRPLFWSVRRPGDAGEEGLLPEPERAGGLNGVKLVGVFGAGKEAGIIALVNGEKQRILVGETLAGWTVDSIRPTGSELRRGGQRETLTLQRGAIKARAPGEGIFGAASARKKTRKSPAAGTSKKKRKTPVATPGDKGQTPEPPASAAAKAADDTAGAGDTESGLSLGPGAR